MRRHESGCDEAIQNLSAAAQDCAASRAMTKVRCFSQPEIPESAESVTIRRRCHTQATLKKIVCIPRSFLPALIRILRLSKHCYLNHAFHVFSVRRRTMAHLFFYCSNDAGIWIDRRSAPLNSLSEAMAQAAGVVRELVMAPSNEDWRGWTLHASDDFGHEVFAVPFASVLGKAH
jgi:hypothetical protein